MALTYRTLLMIQFTVMWAGPALLVAYGWWMARQPDVRASPGLRRTALSIAALGAVLATPGLTLWTWWLCLGMPIE